MCKLEEQCKHFYYVSSAANNFAGWSKTNHEIRQDYTDSVAKNNNWLYQIQKKKTHMKKPLIFSKHLRNISFSLER